MSTVQDALTTDALVDEALALGEGFGRPLRYVQMNSFYKGSTGAIMRKLHAGLTERGIDSCNLLGGRHEGISVTCCGHGPESNGWSGNSKICSKCSEIPHGFAGGDMMIASSNNQLVSVIVPMYNVAPYVADAIESIVRQTYPDIEIVIVDDGSEDSSFDVARDALSACATVKWHIVRQENAGVSAARNKGAREAKGQWLLFLDPDDVLAPETIELLVRGATRSGVEVAISNFTMIDDALIPYRRNLGESFAVMTKDESLRCHLLRTRNMAAPATMVSSRLASMVPFREGCRYGEDVMWVWEILSRADGVVYLESPGYGYRLRPGSTITAPDSVRIKTGASTFLELDNLLADVVENASWASSRWMLGVMHVLARHGSREQFEWFYLTFYRRRISSLLTFPQVRVRILAVVSLLGPVPLRAVLSRF